MKKYITLIIVLLIICLSACDGTQITPTTEAINGATEGTTGSSIEATQETTEAVGQLETYYDRDETINLYLNRFNDANPDQLIDNNLFKVYYHHGKEHDDQIIFTRDDVEVVISGNDWGSSVELVIDGSKEKTADDYKQLFFQYARAFSSDLTDAKLETYWQAVLDDIINSPEFDEFDCSLHTYNDAIEYMIIDGKIS